MSRSDPDYYSGVVSDITLAAETEEEDGEWTLIGPDRCCDSSQAAVTTTRPAAVPPPPPPPAPAAPLPFGPRDLVSSSNRLRAIERKPAREPDLWPILGRVLDEPLPPGPSPYAPAHPKLMSEKRAATSSQGTAATRQFPELDRASPQSPRILRPAANAAQLLRAASPVWEKASYSIAETVYPVWEKLPSQATATMSQGKEAPDTESFPGGNAPAPASRPAESANHPNMPTLAPWAAYPNPLPIYPPLPTGANPFRASGGANFLIPLTNNQLSLLEAGWHPRSSDLDPVIFHFPPNLPPELLGPAPATRPLTSTALQRGRDPGPAWGDINSSIWSVIPDSEAIRVRISFIRLPRPIPADAKAIDGAAYGGKKCAELEIWRVGHWTKFHVGHDVPEGVAAYVMWFHWAGEGGVEVWKRTVRGLCWGCCGVGLGKEETQGESGQEVGWMEKVGKMLGVGGS